MSRAFEMSFDDHVAKAGSLKSLFDSARMAKVPVSKEVEKMLNGERVFQIFEFRIEEIGEGFARLGFPYSEQALRWGRIVHGGVVMTALDYAGGISVMSINTGINQVTMELKVNFLEPLRKGPFSATGRVIRAGKNTAVVEGEVTDSHKKVYAKSLGTWFMIRKKA
jgi:acyl-CoA thioesterase